MFSFFWMILVPLFVTYLYGFITVSKFQFYLRRMEAAGLIENTRMKSGEDSVDMSPWGYAALWPLAMGFEPDQVKGLLFPTLWLWPRFRQEWPALKAEHATDGAFESEMKRKERSRQRFEKRGETRLEDAKEELRHNKRMERLRVDTDAFLDKIVDDHPPELEEGRDYKPGTEMAQPGKAIEPAQEAEWKCVVHRHWVTDSTKMSSCRSEVRHQESF